MNLWPEDFDLKVIQWTIKLGLVMVGLAIAAVMVWLG